MENVLELRDTQHKRSEMRVKTKELKKKKKKDQAADMLSVLGKSFKGLGEKLYAARDILRENLQ